MTNEEEKMEEEVIKKEKTGSYLTGIIGAIIGGIIQQYHGFQYMSMEI